VTEGPEEKEYGTGRRGKGELEEGGGWRCE